MAGVLGRLPSNEVALVAATAKTVLQIVAAANHRTKVNGIRVHGKGIVSTDTPIKVRVVRQTTAGTMSAATPVKNNTADDETLQTTGQKNATVEPTITDVLEEFEVHPQTGQIIFYPFGQEIIVPGGTRLGVELTAAQAQTVTVGIDFEE